MLRPQVLALLLLIGPAEVLGSGPIQHEFACRTSARRFRRGSQRVDTARPFVTRIRVNSRKHQGRSTAQVLPKKYPDYDCSMGSPVQKSPRHQYPCSTSKNEPGVRLVSRTPMKGTISPTNYERPTIKTASEYTFWRRFRQGLPRWRRQDPRSTTASSIASLPRHAEWPNGASSIIASGR